MAPLIGNRKIRFEDGEDAVAADLLYFTRLEDGIGDGRCRDPRNHWHPAACGLDDDLDDPPALGPAQIRELPGRSQGSQSMYASGDEIIAEAIQNLAHDLPSGADRGEKIGEDPVECRINHRGPLPSRVSSRPPTYGPSVDGRHPNSRPSPWMRPAPARPARTSSTECHCSPVL